MRFARTAGMAMLSLIAFVSGGLGLQAISANGNWLVVSGMEGGQELAALSFNYWKLCQIENGTVGCGPFSMPQFCRYLSPPPTNYSAHSCGVPDAPLTASRHLNAALIALCMIAGSAYMLGFLIDRLEASMLTVGTVVATFAVCLGIATTAQTRSLLPYLRHLSVCDGCATHARFGSGHTVQVLSWALLCASLILLLFLGIAVALVQGRRRDWCRMPVFTKV